MDFGNRDSHLLYTNDDKTHLREQILGFLESVDYPVSPRFVSSSLGINPDSTRKVLSKLHVEGLVERPYYGKYNLKPTYGVGVRIAPRVQNLRVSALGVVGVVSDCVVLECDLCRVGLTFGGKRGKVSYVVGAGLGLDPVGLSVVHGWVVGEVERRGLVVPRGDWMVRSAEFLRDYAGLRLEGVDCVTFTDLLGNLEKFYNRRGVRNEVRTRLRDVSLGELFDLLGRELVSTSLGPRLDAIERGLGGVTEALKFTNRSVDKMGRNVQTILEDYFRRLDEG